MNCLTTLYSHQQEALSKIKDKKVNGLFMEMGTGKTLTAISLAVMRREAGRCDRVIYFCPASLRKTVVDEIKKHTGEDACCIHLTKTIKSFWYVVGIESISQSNRITLRANDLITEQSFIILDESDLCKNPAAIRTRRITQMAKKAKYRMILTGTPVGEGIEDLFSQFYFLNWQILGYRSFYSFATQHLEYSENYPNLVVSRRGVEDIATKIAPYVYQVKKQECLDLPPQTYSTYYVSMSREQYSLYQEAKEVLLLSLPDDEIDSYDIFRLFVALREIVSGFWNETIDYRKRNNLQRKPKFHKVQHSRITILLNILEKLPQGKVIIWCNFYYAIEQVACAIAEIYGHSAIAQHHGKTASPEIEIDRWRNEARFLIASPKCSGRGLTLNEAQYAVFYNNDFSYRIREQAEARNHRIRQNQNVHYIDIVCENSIDERIVNALSHKENLAQQFKQKINRLQQKSKIKQELAKI